MSEATTPFVCDECKKLNKNWYAPCPHAATPPSAQVGLPNTVAPSTVRQAQQQEGLDADKLALDILRNDKNRGHLRQLISEAIVAARQRGVEAERERCARLVESFSDEWLDRSAEGVADDIRSGASSEGDGK